MSAEEGRTFSLVAMHRELASVIERLRRVKGPRAEELRSTVMAFKRATDCGDTMAPPL